MRRKTIDALLTSAGLVLALVLLVAGGLLTWGSGFVHDQVHDQLAARPRACPAATARAPTPGGSRTLNNIADPRVALTP